MIGLRKVREIHLDLHQCAPEFFSVSKQNIEPKCDNLRDAERRIGKEFAG
ncbi:hypothetical protein [Paraburkholderia caffeinilytica]